MRHDIAISQAVEKVHSGPVRSRKSNVEGAKTEMNAAGSSYAGTSSSKTGAKHEQKAGKKTKKPPPTSDSLLKCKGKNRCDWMADCTNHKDVEKCYYREKNCIDKGP